MLTSKGFNVVSDEEASHIIKCSLGSFVVYLGAGASVEAGVPTAAGICEELAEECVRDEEENRRFKGIIPSTLSGTDRANFLSQHLEWDDEENRYFNCVKKARLSSISRVEYFRQKLEHVKPAFAHYASSLLMTRKCLSRTAITTNFDKLLENAFADVGQSECQAIRMSDELQFWGHERDKCYVFKLHGDYDTQNILNTDDETVVLDPKMSAKTRMLLTNAGLVVLGSAGREKSIHTLMDALTAKDAKESGVLEHGLLWGVYVGPGQPTRFTEDETAQLVQDRLATGVVGPDIIKLMKRRAGDPTFAFFPIWGCGLYLWSLLRHTLPEPLAVDAEQYLDHELRIGEIFRRKGLSEAARLRHIDDLRVAHKRLNSAGTGAPPPEYVMEAKTTDDVTLVSLAYCNIAHDSLLRDSRYAGSVKAVVSPEDTCLSVGGGAALALAEKAGLRRLLNDLYKFAPIDQGSTAVTSAGKLDAHYLVHAASVEVTEDGASTTPTYVKKTVESVFRCVESLGVDVVWIPLLGAGVADLSPQESAEAIVDALNAWLPNGHKCTVVITVFKKKLLPRHEMKRILEARLTTKAIAITLI